MYYKLPIIKSRHLDSGIVEQIYPHEKAGRKEASRYFRRVGFGVSCPDAKTPGAYIAVGQEYVKHEPNAETIVLITEYVLEELSLEKFFNSLTDNYLLYGADVVYLDRDNESCFRSFWDYLDHNNVKTITYRDAPFKENQFVGIASVRDMYMSKRLKLPEKSQTREQVKNLERASLGEDLAKSFPLANALRHVIAGFLKFPPPDQIDWGGQLGGQFAGGSGWMVR